MPKAKTTKKTKKEDKNLVNGKMFSKENQPTSKAKSQGRERKREAKRIMDEMMKFQNMTADEFKEYLEENGATLKIGTLLTARWMERIIKDPAMLLDWINRHVSKAPQEVSGPDGGDISVSTKTELDPAVKAVLQANGLL